MNVVYLGSSDKLLKCDQIQLQLTRRSERNRAQFFTMLLFLSQERLTFLQTFPARCTELQEDFSNASQGSPPKDRKHLTNCGDSFIHSLLHSFKNNILRFDALFHIERHLWVHTLALYDAGRLRIYILINILKRKSNPNCKSYSY